MLKVANTSDLGKNREAEVNFCITKSKPLPVDIMIPGFPVPVMKWFRGRESRGLHEWPVTPERASYPAKAVRLTHFEVSLDV